MTEHTIAPVTKSLVVPLAPAQAFALFTEGIARWWPLDSHSVGREHATHVVFEATVGGRIYEETDSGETHDWGDVLDVVEDESLRFTWFAGRDRSAPQEVSVTFSPDGSGTRVDLVHTGWERLADEARSMRDGYDTGWDYVFGECYGGAARG